jgi:hypothetical protein
VDQNEPCCGSEKTVDCTNTFSLEHSLVFCCSRFAFIENEGLKKEVRWLEFEVHSLASAEINENMPMKPKLVDQINT